MIYAIDILYLLKINTTQMKEILVIDIETTGFLDKGGKIVEIGMVSLNLDTGDKKILFDSVCHELPLTSSEVENSWIVNNSDLSANEILNSPRLRQLKPEIQNIINSYPLGATAFNNKFDFDFLESRGFNFSKKLACPMKLLTPIMKLPQTRSWTSDKYKWPNVEEAYLYFYPKSDFVEKHRGADDAFHEADIIYNLYKQNIFSI